MLPWGRSDRRRWADPSDTDLTVLLRGVVLGPPVVLNRDIHVPYQAESGMTADDGHVGEAYGAFTGTVSYDTNDAQFGWLIDRLDEWSVHGTPLVFAAAVGRVSTFRDPHGTVAPFPAL